jgi:hypothetical protein
MKFPRAFSLALLVATLPATAVAQGPLAKRALTQADWDPLALDYRRHALQ